MDLIIEYICLENLASPYEIITPPAPSHLKRGAEGGGVTSMDLSMNTVTSRPLLPMAMFVDDFTFLQFRLEDEGPFDGNHFSLLES